MFLSMEVEGKAFVFRLILNIYTKGRIWINVSQVRALKESPAEKLCGLHWKTAQVEMYIWNCGKAASLNYEPITLD